MFFFLMNTYFFSDTSIVLEITIFGIMIGTFFSCSNFIGEHQHLCGSAHHDV